MASAFASYGVRFVPPSPEGDSASLHSRPTLPSIYLARPGPCGARSTLRRLRRLIWRRLAPSILGIDLNRCGLTMPAGPEIARPWRLTVIHNEVAGMGYGRRGTFPAACPATKRLGRHAPAGITPRLPTRHRREPSWPSPCLRQDRDEGDHRISDRVADDGTGEVQHRRMHASRSAHPRAIPGRYQRFLLFAIIFFRFPDLIPGRVSRDAGRQQIWVVEVRRAPAGFRTGPPSDHGGEWKTRR